MSTRHESAHLHVSGRALYADDIPLPADTLLGRGHVGDGHIDFPPITAAVEAAGYTGHIEVEIFNQTIWDAPPDDTAATVTKRFPQIF